MKLASQYVKEGGLDYARSLLRESLDAQVADSVITQIQSQVRAAPFSHLQKARSEQILTFMQDEHPQTIALIVGYLSHQKASEILAALPPDKQIEVVRRMAHMEQTNPEVIREVEAALESRLADLMQPGGERRRRRDGRGGAQPVRPHDREVDPRGHRGGGSRSGRRDPAPHVRLRGHLAGRRQGHPGRSQGGRQRRALPALQDGQRGAQGEDLREHVRAGLRAHPGGDAVHRTGAA